MRIAIIPTTGGADPFRGMEAAVELGVEGVHIGAIGGALDLEHKTPAERRDVLKRIQGYGLTVSALIGWGGHSWGLLGQEGWHPGQAPIDLRLIAAHRLKRRPGASDAAVLAIGGTLDAVPAAPGRAGRSVRAVSAFIQALLEEKRAAVPT